MTASRSAPSGQPDAAVPRQPGVGAAEPVEHDPAGTPGPLLPLGLLGGRAWTGVLAAAVGIFAVGVILLAWPGATLLIVAILLGASLIVNGILRLVEGLTARGESGGTRAAYVLIGLLAGVAGLYCLKHYHVTIVLLAFVVGVFWVIHGVADLATATTSGPFPGRALRAIGGVLSLAAGLVVMFWPGLSLLLLLTILGVWLICYGVLLAGLALALRHHARAAGTAATA
jgi:uncharacterized membrane protein HdeD (DUF308 family)